jgi:hypothetical protein
MLFSTLLSKMPSIIVTVIIIMKGKAISVIDRGGP